MNMTGSAVLPVPAIARSEPGKVRRHVLSILDLTPEEVMYLARRGVDSSRPPPPLPDTVHEDAWLEARGARLGVLPAEPVEWKRPHHGDDPWSFCRWHRRTFAQVMQTPASPELVPA